jgi:MFS family permease
MVVLAGLLMLGTITSKMWQWIILWGFVVSFGFAFCGGLPIQTVLMYWFNINRATAIGIVMTGAALGGFLAQPFYTWLMGIANTWRAGWLNGAVFAFIGLLFSLLVINKPADAGQFPDGLSPEKIKAKEEKQGIRKRPYRTSTSWELNEALKTPTLWFIVIVIIGHIMPLFLVTSHGVLHLMDRGFSQLQAASILGFIILGSGIARFPVGWLGDRIEPRWILTVTLGIMLVMFLGIWKLSNPKIMIAAGMIYGFCYGSQLIMFPTIIGNYYGPERFAGINGVIGPILIAFGAVIPFGGGYIFESTGSYDLAFIALSIFLCISFVISFWLAPPLRREKP